MYQYLFTWNCLIQQKFENLLKLSIFYKNMYFDVVIISKEPAHIFLSTSLFIYNSERQHIKLRIERNTNCLSSL